LLGKTVEFQQQAIKELQGEVETLKRKIDILTIRSAG
jgi:hypothetical protein